MPQRRAPKTLSCRRPCEMFVEDGTNRTHHQEDHTLEDCVHMASTPWLVHRRTLCIRIVYCHDSFK